MPTPLDLLLDPVAIAAFSIYAALIIAEAVAPARPLPAVAGWKARGIASFMVYFFLSSYLPLVWTDSLARFQLVDLAALGTWGGFHAELLKKPIQWQDGYVIPPNEPGLGVELNEEVALAHPYSGKQLHLEMTNRPVG